MPAKMVAEQQPVGAQSAGRPLSLTAADQLRSHRSDSSRLAQLC